MKNKLFLAVVAAAVMVSGYCTDAMAIRLVREPLQWANGLTRTDKLPVSTSFIDTSAAFGTDGWAFPPNASADTVTYGYIMVEQDSAGPVTSNLTAMNFKVLSSRDGINWTAVLAVGTQTVTSGVSSLSFPIWYSSSKAYRAAHTNTTPFGGAFLRFVLDGDTGAIPAARLSLVHWVED